MAIKFVQQALQEKAQQSTEKSLISMLIKNVGRDYPERSHKTVHASDVTKPDFCARQYLLMDHHGVERAPQYINTALKVTFDLGNLTADHMAEEWMGPNVVGKWRCTSCGKSWMFSKKPDEPCPQTKGHHTLKYDEVKYFSESHHISGSMDMLVDTGSPKLKVVELKTMKADDFAKLEAPLAEHRLRTRLYLRLIEDSQNPTRFQVDTQSAKVLYVCRGFGNKHPEYGQILPFKEFDVHRDDQSIQEFLDNGLTVKTHRQNKTVPEKRVCESVACPQAKKCPVRKQCWGS